MASTRDEFEALYEAYLELCNAHDFDGMTAFYTPTIKVNDAVMQPDSVVDQFAPLVAGFPDWKWEVRSLLVDGDLLGLHFWVGGTHLGTFRGIEPTGRRVRMSEFTLYRVEGDKFAEVWDVSDMESLMAQITAGAPAS
ncbi:hypothetical protein CIW49_07535 [Mycolicibacterium sp. P1-18]|uniref:ester cyclase n=1 Tax=Mycolicibacterium sp. P1-18 TaxID=2024615 RepID=UPI0011F1209C|nr:ester cyclase [Mycolicibacterium sp. P1-18]KAA0099469.1 hypothetical protein CIW49_07535 [Mycolicibacterium sp. P1-18]